jgi:hypothetical protein
MGWAIDGHMRADLAEDHCRWQSRCVASGHCTSFFTRTAARNLGSRSRRLTLVVSHRRSFAVDEDNGKGMNPSTRVTSNLDANGEDSTVVADYTNFRAKSVAHDSWAPVEANANN